MRWDDEAVEPQDFPLIQKGVLTTLQTNREGAGWIRPHLEKSGQPFRSTGCAYAWEATDPQLVCPADLSLHPDSTDDTTLAQLREQMDDGVELGRGETLSMDFQQATGLMMMPAFRIKKGKRVARIANAGMLFRSPELWGNLQALGGASSILQVGTQHWKGEPLQFAYSSVEAPPALFKEMSVINPAQKA